jgi:transposase
MRRKYDDAYKMMAIELSEIKGSVKVAAEELGITPGLITQWRIRMKKGVALNKSTTTLTEEQMENKRLRKELKEALLERDILKKAVTIFSKRGE